jgi:hypothetical protein
MATVAQFEPRRAPESPAIERHFTAAEVAELWAVSADTVRRAFEREPGVLVIGDPSPRHKRRHVTLRIPASVLDRVHRRLSVVDSAARRDGRC